MNKIILLSPVFVVVATTIAITSYRLETDKFREVSPVPVFNSYDGALSSGSSGVRFKGHKIRSFSQEETASSLPLTTQTPPFDRVFGGKIKECYQWAVVTTIHVPNESITGVSNMTKWCLVIVGDNITPDDAYGDLAEKDNVFYLSASDQKNFLLGVASATSTKSFIGLMPFNSFARKNIGYLFAVKYGARVVFDFDDDNMIVPLEDGVSVPPPFLYREEEGFGNTVFLKFVESEQSGALPFNPYEFMRPSHNNSWPRGFPIDQLQKNFENWGEQSTNVGDMEYSSIGVIQSLCDGDPDNDAIFRMTRADSTNFTFGRTATSLPLLIPFSAYSPYNAQATTHLYNAFWGLYLPITVPGRVTDIWRSYITQRIMKDIGLYVIYTPPIVQHKRSAHDYLADLAAESDLYSKTSELLKFLDDWSSDAKTLSERMTNLWIALYEHDYVGLDDVEAIKEWLRVLHAVGYKYPRIQKKDDKSTVSQNHFGLIKQPKGPKINNVDILVIVMGEAKSQPLWKTRTGNIEGNASFLYGSYDEEIQGDQCNNKFGMDCETAFIPGTTWTQGRNLLAAQAMLKERRRGKKYDYWVFIDEDIDVECVGQHPQLHGVGDCWQKVFNFIRSDHVPEKVSTIALHSRNIPFRSTSNADAMFAAMKRERIPYLLPYVSLQEGASEWTSQAALFCVIQTCMKSSVLYVPHVKGGNLQHRAYVRGLNVTEIEQTIADNYHDESAGFHPCTSITNPQLNQGFESVIISENTTIENTAIELNDAIPDPELERCEPLRKRFEKWAGQIKE